VASWLVRSSPDRAVRVRALAGDFVLCSWARHLTLTVHLSTQVYKWVPTSRFMPQKPEISAGLMGQLGPNADFTFTLKLFWCI